MSIITAGVDLEVINCWVCGCTFAMSSALKANMRSREETLFCPKGCRLGLGEPHWKKEQQRLRESEEYYRQRSIENRQVAEETKKKLNATRGVVTRIKNRIGKGVCPCCNHTFSDLHRHMLTQHPEFADGKEDANS